jgi:hypothetical protein
MVSAEAGAVMRVVMDLIFGLATRMNPNFEYGQIIRGNGKSATHIGRAEGLISARALVNPIRAVKMLQTSRTRHWSKEDTAGMVDW